MARVASCEGNEAPDAITAPGCCGRWAFLLRDKKHGPKHVTQLTNMDLVDYITQATDAPRPTDHDAYGNPTEDLDDTSNTARDLVRAGQYAQAETLARRLITIWPDQMDGFEIMADVRAAAGDIPAARFYRYQALIRARRFLADQSIDPEYVAEIEGAYNTLDTSAYDRLPASALVDALALSDKWPDSLLLRAIRHRGAEAVAPLRALIQRDVAQLSVDGEAIVSWEADYASLLLITLKRDGVAAANSEEVASDIAGLARGGHTGWLETLPALAKGMGEVMARPLLAIYHELGPENIASLWLLDGVRNAAQNDSTATSPAVVALREAFDDMLPKLEPGRHIDADKVTANELALILRSLGDEQPLKALFVLQDQPGPKPEHRWDEWEVDTQDPQAFKATFNDDWISKHEAMLASEVAEPDPDESPKDAVAKHMAPTAGQHVMLEAPRVSSTAPRVTQTAPYVARARPGRNDPCWCDSGKKYKHCHLAADALADQTRSQR